MSSDSSTNEISAASTSIVAGFSKSSSAVANTLTRTVATAPAMSTGTSAFPTFCW